jgi:hypothetical protein
VVSAAVLDSYQPADPGSGSYAVVTGSRALGTVYTNSTPRTLFAAVTTSVSVAGTLTVAVASANILIVTAAIGSGAVFFAVPPGATYEVIAGGTQTLTSWYEV